jgi:hypothetical protein
VFSLSSFSCVSSYSFVCTIGRGPERAERRQPGIHLLKRLGFQSVETALGIHGALHKAGLAQHAQVLGDARLRETKLTFNVSHRLWDETRRLKIARRFASAMMSNTIFCRSFCERCGSSSNVTSCPVPCDDDGSPAENVTLTAGL